MKMKKIFPALMAFFVMSGHLAAEEKNISIATADTELILRVGNDGRLYQAYLGDRLQNAGEAAQVPWNLYPSPEAPNGKPGCEAYSTAGTQEFFQPAMSLTHADGNPATYLYYVSSEQQPVNGGTETVIRLRDDQYPVNVTLYYRAYHEENVIQAWTEISHDEKRPVTLTDYASCMLYFNEPAYYLTEFSGDWANEAQQSSQQLQFGKKVIDTRLGSRAAMHVSPFFEVGLGQPVAEQQGRVLMGTLGWTGNFRFTFEVDNLGNLRVISGINPSASAYRLKAGEVFRTPEFIFTLSSQGTSQGSRNLHRWALRHQVKDGAKPRMSLLNNWENTYFSFNEDKLKSLIREAKDLGVDLFLLDDGWFGNKHPRNGDNAGLGDWEANREKLPGGIGALTRAARETGVKFGIWIEPEMVNPKSELFEKHPEWVIHQPNRKPYYYRNQLVLDLSNPKVQDYVYSVVENILRENPEVAFFKWDCNSPITNAYSPYLKEEQQQLYVDYVRGLYRVLERIRTNYPDTPMMLCAGGGGRCDYGALKYFTEFWASDNTDPIERLYIQWGFSQFFPAKTICAHVTNWNRSTSVKFRTDVASMCKLGFDIGLQSLSPDERAFCRTAVANWHRLQPVILDGTQYRLVSPYESAHMAVNYVNEEGTHAVLFAYDIQPRFNDRAGRVKLQGLRPDRNYRVEEINLMPQHKPTLPEHGRTFSGDYLMKVGLDVLTGGKAVSHVVEIKAV